jgi:hypothetical protein
MTHLGNYVEINWSQVAGNIANHIILPTDTSGVPIKMIELININVTIKPANVGNHTSYTIHWNSADMIVPSSDGTFTLTNEFMHVPISSMTSIPAANFSWKHFIDSTIQSLEFWVTYEDNSPVVLISIDSQFVLNMMLYVY